jgi:ABC-2 type transport system ATP-binding protein/lipopolysaccharide transport system ATP-binding protein
MNAVELRGVGKRYRLGGSQESYLTIREAAASFWQRRSASAGAELWALRNVDLEIPEGEVLGIIGRNGAGKSTLLKLVAGITAPTRGVVRTRGRVGALLDVGTGFHPELTGRENVFLNAAVLGMSRNVARRQFSDIVAFAGVEKFIDTPLKRYSSGMRLRLAFAVAAHLQPPVVVIDEVLAVADAEFQSRSLGKIAELATSERTVMFVSHDLGAIARLCRRVVWIDEGSVAADGSPENVIGQYLDASVPSGASVDLRLLRGGPIQLLDAATLGSDGADAGVPRRGAPLRIRLRFAVEAPVRGLDIAIIVRDRVGSRLLDEAWSDRTGGFPADDFAVGKYEVTLTIPPVLAVGSYLIQAWFGTHLEEFLDTDVLKFDIRPKPDDRQEWIDRPRLLQPAEVNWSLRTLAQMPSPLSE